ncbi:hypothetical protein PCI56_01180 [Plesiomonas shigelloides subsp. oncorhynchi]|nr:hypothetical protein [Plesiomonas shigelloides]
MDYRLARHVQNVGQQNTGKWTWVFQIDGLDADSVNITHWAEIPELPEDPE